MATYDFSLSYLEYDEMETKKKKKKKKKKKWAKCVCGGGEGVGHWSLKSKYRWVFKMSLPLLQKNTIVFSNNKKHKNIKCCVLQGLQGLPLATN